MHKHYRRVGVDPREHSPHALRAARWLSRSYGDFDELRERYAALQAPEAPAEDLDSYREALVNQYLGMSADQLRDRLARVSARPFASEARRRVFLDTIGEILADVEAHEQHTAERARYATRFTASSHYQYQATYAA